jgi:hypothetical protein
MLGRVGERDGEGDGRWLDNENQNSGARRNTLVFTTPVIYLMKIGKGGAGRPQTLRKIKEREVLEFLI